MRVPRRLGRNSLALAVLLSALLGASPAFAAAGNISSTAKYAWGNDAGWVNFAPSQSGVTVTNSAVTGYAWSENDGWINFSPSQGGVTNDGSGNLGGYAWDETYGWVSFSGVTINSSGKFTGEATGANGYAITFDCSNCDVETTWRSQSTNPTPSASSGLGAISPVVTQPASGATTTTRATSTVSATSTPATPSSPPPSPPSTTYPRTSGQPAATAAATGSSVPTIGSQLSSPSAVQTSATATTPVQPSASSTATSTVVHRTPRSFLSTGTITAGVVALVIILFVVVRWVF